MKVLITGAHFTPAQAVIEELLQVSGIEISYIGRKNTLEGDSALSVESQVLPKLGIKYFTINAGKISRNFNKLAFFSLLKIPLGFVQALYYLLKIKPDIILSFGGFVALPITIVGWLLSIPIIVHEQTLVTGLANKVSTIFASEIALSYPDHELASGSKKTYLVGNPLRQEILNPEKNVSPDIIHFVSLAKKEKLPLILVTGGNQGSHVINKAMEGIADRLLNSSLIVHQTGDSKYQDYERISQKKSEFTKSNRYLLKKWIDVSDWVYLLKHSDLALSRAGANTLYEFAFFQLPALVIPLPFLYGDEQLVNAKFYEKNGLVKILEQRQLDSAKLLETIKVMIKDLPSLKSNAKLAKNIVIKDAAKRLAQRILIYKNAA